jgi:uncharacterized protein
LQSGGFLFQFVGRSWLFSMRYIVVFLLLMGVRAHRGAAQPTPSSSMSTTLPVAASSLRAYVLRLRPGQDVRQELQAFATLHQLRAACVLSAVGSLTTATLRLANQEGPTVYQGHLEVVSLVGTLSVNGSHLHLSVADSTGRTLGGHLLEGNRVYTTLEVVLGELPELEFRREPDTTFGYQELAVYPAAAPARRKNRPLKNKNNPGA